MKQHILVNSAKYRVNPQKNKNNSNKLFFMATQIAEDIIKELDDSSYKRRYKDNFINYLNKESNGELKHIICNAFLNISKRSFGYKPLFKHKQSTYQKRLIEIIPLQTCFHCLNITI